MDFAGSGYIICLISVFAFMLITLYVISEIAIRRRLRALIHTITQLHTGDLSARTRIAAGWWEFGELARSLNAMAESIEHRQDQQRQSEERFRAIFEGSAIGMILLDQHGAILQTNPRIGDMLGYNDAEIKEIGMAAFVDTTDTPFAALLDKHAEQEQNSLRIEARCFRKDSSLLRCCITLSFIQNADNGARFAVAMFEDVTERSVAEDALRRANSQLTEWVSELEQRAEELRLLNAMGDLLQSCLTTEEAYSIVSQSVSKLFFETSGALSIINPQRTVVEVVAAWGEMPSDRVFMPTDCWALRRGRLHLVTDQHSGPHCRHIWRRAANASLCVPMLAQGEALGALHLRGTRFSTQQQELALTVAEHISLALANLRLRETLHHRAIRDSLSGLFNRHYLEEALDREVRRAMRRSAPLGVIMIDLDHFKQFNDTFGHSAGDALLQALGAFLRSNIRNEDIACRYGGEEFMIILPSTTLEDAQRRADQLRVAVKQLTVQHQGQLLSHVSLSLGVALFPNHGDTVELLVSAADKALYRAKAAGRDCVMLSTYEQPETARLTDG